MATPDEGPRPDSVRWLYDTIESANRDPTLIAQALEQSSAGILARVSTEILEEERIISKRWGTALDLFEVAREVMKTIGEAIDTEMRDGSGEVPTKTMVLVYLQIRACRTAGEVLALLRTGFAIGALARWRTLHEIQVVSAFLQDLDPVWSHRFHAHHAVELAEQVEGYAEAWPDHVRVEDRDKAREALASARMWQPSLLGHWGWARGAPGIEGKATFAAIQKALAARFKQDLPSYKQASTHGIHSHSIGTFTNLMSSIDPAAVWADRSNVGLQVGGDALRAFFAVTRVLVKQHTEQDPEHAAPHILATNAARDLTERAAHEFVRAAKGQEDDERIIRAGRAGGSSS